MRLFDYFVGGRMMNNQILVVIASCVFVTGLAIGYNNGATGGTFYSSYELIKDILLVPLQILDNGFESSSVLGLFIKGIFCFCLAVTQAATISGVWLGHLLSWLPSWLMNPILDVVGFLPVLFSIAFLGLTIKQLMKGGENEK